MHTCSSYEASATFRSQWLLGRLILLRNTETERGDCLSLTLECVAVKWIWCCSLARSLPLSRAWVPPSLPSSSLWSTYLCVDTIPISTQARLLPKRRSYGTDGRTKRLLRLVLLLFSFLSSSSDDTEGFSTNENASEGTRQVCLEFAFFFANTF